jgi:hypothetical protein
LPADRKDAASQCKGLRLCSAKPSESTDSADAKGALTHGTLGNACIIVFEMLGQGHGQQRIYQKSKQSPEAAREDVRIQQTWTKRWPSIS